MFAAKEEAAGALVSVVGGVANGVAAVPAGLGRKLRMAEGGGGMGEYYDEGADAASGGAAAGDVMSNAGDEGQCAT